MSYLFDTNAVAEIRRPRPHPGFMRFFADHAADRFFTTEITIAEIRYGIERARDTESRLQYARWLDEVVRPMFRGRVLGTDEDVWLRWRLLLDDGRRTGYTFPQPDLMIAAIAAHHELTVVSRDAEPFRRARIPVVDPWSVA